MPVPATLTSYLPVLLVSVTNHAIPDDTSFSTQPSGQVDYLSHEWREEDVWRSWRNMTRQKNAIANGMRLENASWRTWWKQRNKLKTISPETLNWLKDSDVTWLYGPLHIGSDWTKHDVPSYNAYQHGRGDSPEGSRPPTPAGKKPILKRRSISQLLSLPASPFFHNEGSDSDDGDIAHDHNDEDQEEPRPVLLHTKSDTHISSRIRAFRKESPPRILSPELSTPHHDLASGGSTSNAPSSNTSTSTGSSQDLSGASISGADGASGVGSKKKHISFNTFVEQYISIEKPKRKFSEPIFYSDSVYNQGFSEDSEADNDEEQNQPSSFYFNDRPGLQSDSDEDDEDEVLEIRSRRSRSSSSSRSDRPSAMRRTSPGVAQPARRPPIARQSSTDREHMTIAPIAPTMLKSTGVGNNLATISEDKTMRSQKEVELVYLPPSGSIYSLPGTPSIGAEDVYHHRESYFSVGTSPSAPASSSSPFLGSRSADNIPSSVPVSLPTHTPRQTSHQGSLNRFFVGAPADSSPVFSERDVREDAYDYFGGPDLGEEYHRRTHSSSSRRSTDEPLDDPGGGRYHRYGGASSAGHTPMSRSPRIVVNEVAGAMEEREEMLMGIGELPVEVTTTTSLSRKADVRVDDIPLAVSFIHRGPTVPVSVPRVATNSNSTGTHSPQEGTTAFLSPTDAVLVSGRGRSPGRCSPTSGSTTTGSYSFDSRSESRGRSSTRNSSSESSRGTNSPMGSISPTGSGIGIGIGGGYGAYKGRKSAMRKGSLEPVEERGRDRTGRRIASSLSPPSGANEDFPAYSPVLQKTVLPSPAPSVSGSSVSGSSTASGATAKPGCDVELLRRGRSPLRFGIPPVIPEEEETRSRQPTPANSPVRALSHHATSSTSSVSHSVFSPPGAPSLHVTPPKSRPSAPVTSQSEAQATPSSPTTRNPSPRDMDEQQVQAGLVGRAAEIVSQAKGFLGSIWSAV